MYRRAYVSFASIQIKANLIICNIFLDTRIPTAKAKYLFGQIVLACEYIQSLNLVHRDIKDEVS